MIFYKLGETINKFFVTDLPIGIEDSETRSLTRL
jgi:hypothetical protein